MGWKPRMIAKINGVKTILKKTFYSTMKRRILISN